MPTVPEPDNRSVTQLGVVGVGPEAASGGSSVYGAGAFFSPVDYQPEDLRITDRCQVYSAESPPPPTYIDDYAALLDAGPQIELEAAGQPYFTLARVNFVGGGYGYTAGEFLGNNIPLPEGTLSATVPGAAFPTFSAEFPAVPPLLELAGDTMPTLTPDGLFSWEPYLPGGAVSVLTFQVWSEDFTGVYADCVAADDGSFALPAETKTELLRLVPDFVGAVSSPDRTVYRVVHEDEVALILSFGDAPIRYPLGG